MDTSHDLVLPPELIDRVLLLMNGTPEEVFLTATVLRSRYVQIKTAPLVPKMSMDEASGRGRVDLLDFWMKEVIPTLPAEQAQHLYSTSALEGAMGSCHSDVVRWWLSSGLPLVYRKGTLFERAFMKEADPIYLELLRRVAIQYNIPIGVIAGILDNHPQAGLLAEMDLSSCTLKSIAEHISFYDYRRMTAKGQIALLRLVDRALRHTELKLKVQSDYKSKVLRVAALRAFVHGDLQPFKWWIEEIGLRPGDDDYLASPHVEKELWTRFFSSHWDGLDPAARRENVTRYLDFLEVSGTKVRWIKPYGMGPESLLPCQPIADAPDWFSQRGLLQYQSGSDSIPFLASLHPDVKALRWWSKFGDIRTLDKRNFSEVALWDDIGPEEVAKVMGSLSSRALAYHESKLCDPASPIECAILGGDAEVLRIWTESAGPEFEYSPNVMDCAVLLGRFASLEWAQNHGNVRYTDNLLDLVGIACGGMTAVEILSRFRDTGLEMKYTWISIDILSAENNVAGLEWWRKSGLAVKFSERAIKWAREKGAAESLAWWESAAAEMEQRRTHLQDFVENLSVL
jgi:hypothetical protein